MRGVSRSRSDFPWRFLSFSAAVSLQFLSGLCDGDASATKDVAERADSGSNGVLKFLFIFIGMVASGLFSFCLFKLWQKRKREEQYARLLKLFEEDDELEVELGLRD